jgi:hypothetical protein
MPDPELKKYLKIAIKDGMTLSQAMKYYNFMKKDAAKDKKRKK